MDPQYSLVSRDEFWRLQNEMKNVSSTQAEHADRLTRLERRQDDDGRTKSIWGGASPFPAPVGTPATEPAYNPAAEAFKNFDQDQSASMMGSLHLDAEEEPRRGTSRANSVRFDESALGHFGHSSRPSSDFFPMRSNSAFGSHPLTERTASHKSEGRQSSTHSARLNSMGSEGRASAAPGAVSVGPPPGLFLLGPLPSIIRCWLDTNYSNDTLLYAGVCTGSYKSTLSSRLVDRIGQSGSVREQDGEKRLRIPVYLPEATISSSSSRSASPAPSLPAVTVDFIITELDRVGSTIEVLLGSDLLRLKNADILFSQDKLSMIDDDNNRLTIPLVRPENTELFKHLVTTSAPLVNGSGMTVRGAEEAKRPDSADKLETLSSISRGDAGSDIFASSLISAKRASVIGDGRRLNRELDTSRAIATDTETSSSGTVETPARPDPNTVASWRRDASAPKETVSFSTVASNSSQRGGRGNKSMKVLRPSRSSTSRSVSAIQSPLEPGLTTPRWLDTTTASSSGGEGDGAPLSAVEGRSTLKQQRSNPVGGASAFSWMSPSGQRTS